MSWVLLPLIVLTRPMWWILLEGRVGGDACGQGSPSCSPARVRVPLWSRGSSGLSGDNVCPGSCGWGSNARHAHVVFLDPTHTVARKLSTENGDGFLTTGATGPGLVCMRRERTLPGGPVARMVRGFQPSLERPAEGLGVLSGDDVLRCGPMAPSLSCPRRLHVGGGR